MQLLLPSRSNPWRHGGHSIAISACTFPSTNAVSKTHPHSFSTKHSDNTHKNYSLHHHATWMAHCVPVASDSSILLDNHFATVFRLYWIARSTSIYHHIYRPPTALWRYGASILMKLRLDFSLWTGCGGFSWHPARILHEGSASLDNPSLTLNSNFITLTVNFTCKVFW